MSLISSGAVLAAIASVSLGGCAKGDAARAQSPHSPSQVYRLCSDIRFRCVLGSDVQGPAQQMLAPTPIQIDTNLAAPVRRAPLG